MEVFEAHLIHVGLAYPNTLQTLARLLVTYAGLGYPLTQRRMERLLNALIAEHAPLAHHSEVAWCLWMAIALNLDVSSAGIDAISEMHSSVCALLLLDLHHSGRLSKAPKLTYWKQFETQEALHGDMWLLSYEAGVRGWGGYTSNHVASDKHFSTMQAAGVRFYRQNTAAVPFFTLSETAHAYAEQKQVADVFELEDIDDFLEFSEEEEGWYGTGASLLEDDEGEELPF